MSTFLSNISVRDLRRAINLRERIEKLQRALAVVLGSAEVPAARGGYGSRKISAAGRARIAAAQRARWAKAKGSSKGGRTMNAAARAKIAAAARKRWARAKAAGKRTLAA